MSSDRFSELEEELKAARQELADAQAVLAAIRSGEADAVVIETAAGPKVYTLRGADEPYRTIVENLREGAVTVDGQGIILYCNEAFATLIGRKTSCIVGHQFGDIAGYPVNSALLSADGSPGIECVLARVDGSWRHCQVSSTPHATEVGTIHCLLVTDLTGQELRLKYNAIIDSTDDAVMSFDVDGRITSWNPAAERLFGYTAAEASGCNADLLVAPLSSIPPGETARGAFDHALSGTSFRRDTRRVAKDGTVIDVSVTASPIRRADGQIIGVSAIMRDIRDRKRAEEREHLLMREVNHRSKNMLGLVQAIARQTAATEPVAFVDRFVERICALSASQDVLVNSGWKSVPLDALVKAQLAHFGDALGTRIQLRGTSLEISPAAAQAIGLALHELATNAAKYGALSNEDGSVTVDWGLGSNDVSGLTFEMSWTEMGGPPVTPPSRQGFGTTVLSKLIKMGLDGEVVLDYRLSGLVWNLLCPASSVLETSARATTAFTSSSERKRILIAEDEALIAADVAAMLTKSGFDVLGPVGSVDQALRLIENGGCDAAVLDVNLGAETSEPIAARLSMLGTPFVTISGYGREQMPPMFRTVRLIGKPIQPNRLVDELQHCLS